MNIIKNVDIKIGYRTDHSSISLELDIGEELKGGGGWGVEI